MSGLFDSPAFRVAAWSLALALVALPVVAVVNGWAGAQRWPLRTLRVTGDLHRVDPAELQALLRPFARRGYFAVQLDEAQAAVARLPWVEHAEVRKRWPDVLEVAVVEHRPFARWGRDRVLSQEGKLFPVAGIELPKALPLLEGPDERVPAVMALYGEARELFAPAGIDVRALRLDRRGSWELELADGIDVVVGSREARSRLDRFARLLPRLIAQGDAATKGASLLRADLRYTNGFALTWGEPATP
jgi:cell division protein FtsQ